MRVLPIISFAMLWMLSSSRLNAGEPQPNRMDTFAECLTAHKAVMYGSFLCPHCEDQKKIFGSSFRFIHYVECLDSETRKALPACKAAEIHVTPTWTFSNGNRLVGTQPIDQLGKASGCPIP